MLAENLKDIKNSELLDIILELLYECEHIIVLDLYYSPQNITNDLILGIPYTFIYEEDIDVCFELSNDKDYPIKMSYETTYSHQRKELDCITIDLFNKRSE